MARPWRVSIARRRFAIGTSGRGLLCWFLVLVIFRLRFGDVDDVDVDVFDLVDADLVVGALERLVAADEVLAVADERRAHRAAAVVDDVVVAAQHVLAEFEVPGERPRGQRFVDVGHRCVFGVVLALGFAALFPHREQQREGGVRSDVRGSGRVLEIFDTPLVHADDAAVQHEQPRPP